MFNPINQQLLAYTIGGIGIFVEWWAYSLSCGLAFRRWSALGAILWAAQYFLLDAWTAGVSMACTAIRSLLSARLQNQRYQHGLAALFVLLFAALAALSWQGLISLLPTFAVVNTTLALFYCGNRTMRMALLASSLAWIANDFYWQAWPALVAESVAVVINLRTIRQLFKN